MAGVIPRFTHGPVTYDVAERVNGGQIVEARVGGKVGVAAAGSTKVLGVATKDAAPSYTVDGTTPSGYPDQDLSAVYLTPYVAVGKDGEWPVTFAAAAAFGDLLMAAANGQVTVWDGVAAGTIIGRCTDPAGVAAGAVGLFKFGL